MKEASTLLGKVVSVTGSTISIYLSQTVSSGLAIINGTTYKIGQVGSFVKMPQGYKDLYGVVCEVGAEAAPEKSNDVQYETGRWIKAQLVGESVGSSFERGISQHPNVGDLVHLVTDEDLKEIYGTDEEGHVEIGRLSSAENIKVKIDIDKLITRHSAVLGSTGSGKSTTVASLLRSISGSDQNDSNYPSARILLIDIHGEYSSALSDVSSVFRINPNKNENKLSVPYWALDTEELVTFLFGGMSDTQENHVYDKITELKLQSIQNIDSEGVEESSLTLDTPVPYSLKKLWYDLINPELMTLEGTSRDEPAQISEGNAETLTEPKYKPHAMGNQGPFLNTSAPGIKRQLRNLRSKLLNKQFDFLLHPGAWEPNIDGKVEEDLPNLLQSWLGHDKPITILDLSGVPSHVLVRLVGSILKIVYTALFWSREKSEGGLDRPLLIVMEEAHRYLHNDQNNTNAMVQQIVKEGRKYGVGAMIVSQRPSEVDETILSQCGTFFALRLSNPADRAKVKGTLPDSLAGLMDMLPILRTGEAIITGEAATLPIRTRITLPIERYRPRSEDPKVSEEWKKDRRSSKYMNEIYNQMAASWRSQSPFREKDPEVQITREPTKDSND